MVRVSLPLREFTLVPEVKFEPGLARQFFRQRCRRGWVWGTFVKHLSNFFTLAGI